MTCLKICIRPKWEFCHFFTSNMNKAKQIECSKQYHHQIWQKCKTMLGNTTLVEIYSGLHDQAVKAIVIAAQKTASLPNS